MVTNKTQLLFIHSGGSQQAHTGSSDLLLHVRVALTGTCEVFSPAMPDPEKPSYRNWRNTLASYMQWMDQGVMLVGHSLGGSVLVKFLTEERGYGQPGGLFLVSAPFWGNGSWPDPDFEAGNHFGKKLQDLSKVFLYHSREDQVVPFRHMLWYAEELPGASLRALDGSRHLFNDGLSELMDDVKQVIRQQNR